MEKFKTFINFNIDDLGMVFKQRFKYLNNNFIKVILKLKCLFYQNIYIFYFLLFCIPQAISTQTNPKSVTVEKKPTI